MTTWDEAGRTADREELDATEIMMLVIGPPPGL